MCCCDTYLVVFSSYVDFFFVCMSNTAQTCTPSGPCLHDCRDSKTRPVAYSHARLRCLVPLQIDDSEEEKAKREELKASYEPLCRLIKDILSDKVEKVGPLFIPPLERPQSPACPSCVITRPVRQKPGESLHLVLAGQLLCADTFCSLKVL